MATKPPTSNHITGAKPLWELMAPIFSTVTARPPGKTICLGTPCRISRVTSPSEVMSTKSTPSKHSPSQHLRARGEIKLWDAMSIIFIFGCLKPPVWMIVSHQSTIMYQLHPQISPYVKKRNVTSYKCMVTSCISYIQPSCMTKSPSIVVKSILKSSTNGGRTQAVKPNYRKLLIYSRPPTINYQNHKWLNPL